MTRPLALTSSRKAHRTPVPATRRSTLATELLTAASVPLAMLLALVAISAPLVAASMLAATALAVYTAHQALLVAPATRRRPSPAVEREA